MPIAPVGTSVVGSGANTFTTASRDYSGATLLTASVSQNALDGGVLSDSLNNIWQTDGPERHVVSPPYVRLYYAKNAIVGAGQTFTLTASNMFAVLSVAAWSGVDTSAPLDQQIGTGANFTSPAQPGSMTPTADNELVVSACGWNAAKTITSVTGMTILDQTDVVGGTHHGGGHAYVIQTTALAINPPWNFASGTLFGNVVQASFKAAPPPDLAVLVGEPITGSSLIL